ncbi:MAG: nucleotidyltransferase family protein [Oscillospiraceae bacterium]|jgi:hypothetical protein|nr:nucleotidyltransferase family protein [Oscillospiraceae bacterium]MDD3230404.1 nucleotidyltransferase family protein [Oscillospiraceae bacterium]
MAAKAQQKILQALVLLMRGYLQKTSGTETVKNVQLLSFARQHSVIGLTAQALSLDPTLEAAQRRYCTGVEMAVLQRTCEKNFAFSQIAEAFEAQKIPCLPVKGFRIGRAYPVPELREMGDWDIVIHPEDREAAASVFAKAGYAAGEHSESSSQYQKDEIVFEIHTLLFPSLCRLYPKCRPFLQNLWQCARQAEASQQFFLTETAEFLMMVLHMASHFYYGNCGIRFFLDLAMYLDQYSMQIDWKIVLEQMQTFGLSRFLREMLALTAKWFPVNLPDDILQTETFQNRRLEQMILSGGTYGYVGRSNLSLAVKTDYALSHKKTGAKHLLCAWIFRPINHLQGEYTYLKKYPFLYPLSFFQRAVRWLRRRKGRDTFASVRDLPKEADRVSQEFDLLHKIGLK